MCVVLTIKLYRNITELFFNPSCVLHQLSDRSVVRLSLHISSLRGTYVAIGSHTGMLQKHWGFENTDGEGVWGDISLSHDLELILHISSISLGLCCRVTIVTESFVSTAKWKKCWGQNYSEDCCYLYCLSFLLQNPAPPFLAHQVEFHNSSCFYWHRNENARQSSPIIFYLPLLSDDKEHPHCKDPKIQSAHTNTWGTSGVIDRQSVCASMFSLFLSINKNIFRPREKRRGVRLLCSLVIQLFSDVLISVRQC